MRSTASLKSRGSSVSLFYQDFPTCVPAIRKRQDLIAKQTQTLFGINVHNIFRPDFFGAWSSSSVKASGHLSTIWFRLYMDWRPNFEPFVGIMNAQQGWMLRTASEICTMISIARSYFIILIMDWPRKIRWSEWIARIASWRATGGCWQGNRRSNTCSRRIWGSWRSWRTEWMKRVLSDDISQSLVILGQKRRHLMQRACQRHNLWCVHRDAKKYEGCNYLI